MYGIASLTAVRAPRLPRSRPPPRELPGLDVDPREVVERIRERNRASPSPARARPDQSGSSNQAWSSHRSIATSVYAMHSRSSSRFCAIAWRAAANVGGGGVRSRPSSGRPDPGAVAAWAATVRVCSCAAARAARATCRPSGPGRAFRHRSRRAAPPGTSPARAPRRAAPQPPRRRAAAEAACRGRVCRSKAICPRTRSTLRLPELVEGAGARSR